jgi:hypothetical protein
MVGIRHTFMSRVWRIYHGSNLPVKLGHFLIVNSETVIWDVILRSPAEGRTTKNLLFRGCAEILRGVYPFDGLRAGSEPAEGLRMTQRGFRMDNRDEPEIPLNDNEFFAWPF